MSKQYTSARWFLHDWRQRAELKELPTETEFAGERTEAGYVLEGIIPWAPLGIEPELGVEVAFQFYINDRDEQGYDRLLFFPAENGHASSLPYRTLRLAESPAAPVRAIERVTLPPDERDPVNVAVELRYTGAATEFELFYGEAPVQRAVSDTMAPIRALTFELAASRFSGLDDKLTLRASGEMLADIAIDPVYLTARELLARGREAAARIAAGRIPAERTRAGAMVMASTDLFEQTVIDQGERDLSEVSKRAQNAAVSARQLEEALKLYEEDGDPFADRRGGFLSAYLSTADGSGQIYSLYVPPHYDPERAWPLHVNMHGYGGTYGGARAPEPAPDYLMAFVDGRGQTGYEGLGERDVLEVIASIRHHYSIDPDRIYARGGSMGGRGTWSLTTRNPDLFAAALPDYGWATELFIENLGNVPVWNFHDDTDWTVAIDHSRTAVGKLRELGYPIIHTEATGGGHSTATFELQEQREAWLATQVRDPYPRRVRHAASTPYRGKSYWVEILEFADPNRPARVDARAADGNQLYLTTENTRLLRVSLVPELFDRQAPLWVLGQGDPRSVPAPLPARFYVLPGERDGVQISLEDPRPVRAYRPYIAGGLYHIWSSGEPFVIVRPTQGGDAALLDNRRELCDFLSRETGSSYGEQMPIGRIPVVDDVEVTDGLMQRHNLILVGPASANAVLRRLMHRLPVAEFGDSLSFGDDRYRFSDRGYALFYYNPEAPQRYIGVISAPHVKVPEPRVLTSSINDQQEFGFRLLQIAPVERGLRRVQWDAQWRPLLRPGDEEPIPEPLARIGAWTAAFAAAANAATGSDYFLEFAPEDPEAPVWDHTLTRWGDLRVELERPTDLSRASLTGAQLLDLARAVADSLEGGRFTPAVEAEQVQTGAIYRVSMPAWMSWVLAGTLHRNLPGMEWKRTQEIWQHFLRQQKKEGTP